MSLDGFRDAYCREKRIEIANCELSRKRKLRELYRYTALLSAGSPPQLHDWALALADDPSESERRFLDENDITQGRRFNDATLPYPFQTSSLPSTLPFQPPAVLSKPSQSPAVGAPASLEEQLRAASASPSVPAQPLPSVEAPVGSDAAPVAKARPRSSRIGSRTPAGEEEATDEAHAEKRRQSTSRHPSQTLEVRDNGAQRAPVPDGPSADPKDAAPPTSEDAIALDDPSILTVRTARPARGPRVVHLPPQDVQEARLKETERNLEKAGERERREDEKLGLVNGNAPVDVASSPSSTVGPYSQATPHAPHHSPDTSPDTETFQEREEASAAQDDLMPDPAAVKAKEDHDRALQLQMQEARELARGDSPDTPDVERQLQDEQAIRLARDGKGRLSESESGLGPHTLTEDAEQVAREVQAEHAGRREGKPSQPAAADSLPTPTTTAPEPEPALLGRESTDGEAVESQDSARARPEHPTPPADKDVEMDDAPPADGEDEASLRPEPAHPGRMTTRVSSGAIRRKSVTDMIKEHDAPRSALTPRSSNLSAPDSPERPRSRDRRGKEVPTVVFAKPDANRSSKALQLYSEDYASLQGASQDPNRDYLLGLFQYQAHHAPRSLPLSDLVTSAKKTVSTSGAMAMLRASQDYKILKRVYQLQNANRWSLRQIQKSAEPLRPTSHIDCLLKEMKWMQTDFKEERKWKRALAATFAEWCAEYVNSSPEERASLRIRARRPEHAQPTRTADEDMNDAPTPDLVPSGAHETESESFADDEEPLSPFASNPPSRLFSLDYNDVVMKIEHTPASEAMLGELPVYEPLLEGSSDITPASFCDPPILPVSKFVTGKLVSSVRGPPRKRSRYEYESEDEPSSPPSRSGTSAEHSMPSTPGRRLYHRNDLPAEMTDVALFNPENKHVRDRLQASHQFRPPTEFSMPSVSFFESRSSSQWLWEEDQKLRSLVKEYTFNWSLIAQELCLPSKFISGSGRRTPWECFERWVMMEGLPNEMSKTQYFRTYQDRLAQAQKTVSAQHHAQQQILQQQAQIGQAITGQPRRKTTQPIRVERRRDNRHLAIIDGMRKLARKRESLAHKQAESQKAAALRKAHESAPPKSNIHTPQEFSKIKWEREEKMREKLQQQQQQQQQRDAALRQQMAQAAAAQRQALAQGQAGMPNGIGQQQRNGAPGNASVPAPSSANPGAQAGHAAPNAGMVRQHPGQVMPGNFSNANMSGMAINNSGVPQAQMQAHMQNGQRMQPPDQVRMAMQRGQFPTGNQQQYQLQQQQINMASSLTASMNMGNSMPNATMIASMAGQNMNGNMNASLNGMNGMGGMSNNAGSPRMNQMNAQMQSPARPLSSGHMPQLLQIQNNLKVQHPDWTQDQITKMASDQLQRFLAKQRASAMSAAAGATPGMASSSQIGNNVYLQNGGIPNSPSPSAVQNYQTQLLQQQRMMSQQRQQAGSPGMNAVRPASRSATPQNPQMGLQSPGGQQTQLSRS